MSADTWVKVTDDPALDALLWERVDTMSSRALAEYAHSIGLFPPGYGPGMNPAIALAWPPDTPDDGDGILVWDIGDERDAEQAEPEEPPNTDA